MGVDFAQVDLANLDVQPFLENASLAWSVGLGAAALVGLLLWLAGGRLAKTGVVLAGFVLGGLVAVSVAVAWTAPAAGEAVNETGEAVAATGGEVGAPWVIGLGLGGAIAGALLAVLLYRLWMGLATAVALAMVVPAATLIWTGTTPGVDEAQLDAAAEELQDAAVEAGGEVLTDPDVAASLTGDLQADLSSEAVRAAATQHAQRFLDLLGEAWANQRASLRVWWDGLTAAQRSAVTGGAAIGALVGLILGVALPKVAAAVQTALVGTLLMYFPGTWLLERYVLTGEASSGWLPGTPRGVLLTLGLITLLGLLIQCTVLRKKTDK